MLSIDPNRVDLAAEYKACPLGPHSPDLQRVLQLMCWIPATQRYIAAQTQTNGPWYLARTTGPKGSPLEIYTSQSFATETQANWAVFRKRWQLQTGHWLRLDDDDGEDPTLQGFVPSTDLVKKPLLGYASDFSVENGQQIDFKISALTPGHYRASLVRLRCADRDQIGHKETAIASPINGDYPARPQAIHAGSFIDLPADPAFDGGTLTLQAYIWPTLLGTHQALLGTWDADQSSGYALTLDGNGALALVLGDGVRTQIISTDVTLLERHWYLVAASFDVTTGEAWIAQRPLTRYARADTTVQQLVKLTANPINGAGFRIAAWHRSGSSASQRQNRAQAAGHYNGKMEQPTVWSRALSAGEREDLITRAQPVQSDDDLVARWDFSLDIPSQRVVDVSGNGHDGVAINLPTRAVKGRLWDGSDYRWLDRPEHYAAIHFHDDDLYDCGWQTDFSLNVPQDLTSGLYCVHLEQGEEHDWIPFVVRPPLGSATAELALVLPSASYWAYANRHGVITYAGREHVKGAFSNVDPTALYLHHHPELGLSMYDEHSDGSGVCYSSRLRPVLSLRPGEALWQLPADTHIIDWLDEKGIAYDVLSEDDLDKHGFELLAPYRCVMTGSHPEYPSKNMLDAIEEFQNQGGRFIYFGGNGFYWRVSYHPQLPGVIEMRRAEDGIRAWLAEGGEYYHASTGELGGMWRRMGRAPQSVAGTGMTAQGFDFSTYYERTEQSRDPRAAFIFAGIDEAERIGDFGILGGGAAGWEIDRADPMLGTPPHALVVASATTFSANYHWMKEELTHTHAAITGETCPLVRCDMVFYETLNGGAVFSTSSIAWAGALAHNNYDNNVSHTTQNVIERFLNPTPF